MYRSAKANSLSVALVDTVMVSLLSDVRTAATLCVDAVRASSSGTSAPMTYNKLRVSNTIYKYAVTKQTTDDENHTLNCALGHRFPQDRADLLHGTIVKVQFLHLAT